MAVMRCHLCQRKINSHRNHCREGLQDRTQNPTAFKAHTPAAQLQVLHKDTQIRSIVTRDFCSQWKEMGISSHSAYLSSDLASKLDVLLKHFKLHRKNIALGNWHGALENKGLRERNQLLQEG